MANRTGKIKRTGSFFGILNNLVSFWRAPSRPRRRLSRTRPPSCRRERRRRRARGPSTFASSSRRRRTAATTGTCARSSAASSGLPRCVGSTSPRGRRQSSRASRCPSPAPTASPRLRRRPSSSRAPPWTRVWRAHARLAGHRRPGGTATTQASLAGLLPGFPRGKKVIVGETTHVVLCVGPRASASRRQSMVDTKPKVNHTCDLRPLPFLYIYCSTHAASRRCNWRLLAACRGRHTRPQWVSAQARVDAARRTHVTCVNSHETLKKYKYGTLVRHAPT